ncbi:MAG: HU family DNA-binding protein [Patescibacteria group bacterium]
MAAETLKREQIAQKLADKHELSKKQSVEIVNDVIEITTQALKSGVQVKFPGLGTFKVKDRNARTAINPRTGEKVDVPAKRVPRFTAAKELKLAVMK